MGNGNVSGQKKAVRSKSGSLSEFFARKRSDTNRVFFACTDKAQVITEILEERGWSRTRDNAVTDFTIKWCLEHQVDWQKFQEGKQLINNIPGQITFADKVNLWYTIRDYLNSRRTLVGSHVQTFLPMTFVLDDGNELAEFLRVFKKQNRLWICKPRYSYAGQGIHVLSGNSNLDTVLKTNSIIGKRPQHQPKFPGHIMQEYISRPLLIKGRKFDMRVHWLVAWTKPLIVFYNHHASVIRLSLNLYREFDFDRATHLTNLSVQENHYRYAGSQEETGMTMQQLNQYFNKCFRPFHPQLCEDWVMTVMQDRMHTIIRQVVRASKDKLERIAGHFGLFGCDFLLDENFRLWLLEVNDNPGVGWGNTQVNTTTKPLFEETLNIVFECFDNYKNRRSLLPVRCLEKYQLIYHEDDDKERIRNDDNQVFSDKTTIRIGSKDLPAISPASGTLPRISHVRSSMSTTAPTTPATPAPSTVTTTTSTTIATDLIVSSEIILPSATTGNVARMIAMRERKPLTVKPDEAQERFIKLKALKEKYTFSLPSRSIDKLNQLSFKRPHSSMNMPRRSHHKRRPQLKPITTEKKHSKEQSASLPTCAETVEKENTMIIKESESEQ